MDYTTNLKDMIFTEVNTFSSIVSSAFSGLSINKWRRDFLLEIFMFYLVIPGRINFNDSTQAYSAIVSSK
jgi:hypothetical protein